MTAPTLPDALLALPEPQEHVQRMAGGRAQIIDSIRVVGMYTPAEMHAYALANLGPVIAERDAWKSGANEARQHADRYRNERNSYRIRAECAEAENAKLREALEQIESIDCTCATCREAITNYARAALNASAVKGVGG